MKLEHEILVNKYGQDIVGIEPLLLIFERFEISSKKDFLNDIVFLILQSKPQEEDIEPAIEESGLKSTYTPCVLLKKGVANNNLQRLVDLPNDELKKVFVLLFNLFRIAYKRRFTVEKDNPDKWWYWNLSDENNIRKIEKML
jgi:hypothetical protein